jgi:hypothetical protein
MLEKEMRSCLESFVLPGNEKIAKNDIDCHPGQCTGYSHWGNRESTYEIPGMHFRDPALKYNPMARRKEILPRHVLDEARRLLEHHARGSCKLTGVRADVHDDVNFRRLEFKLWTR